MTNEYAGAELPPIRLLRNLFLILMFCGFQRVFPSRSGQVIGSFFFFSGLLALPTNDEWQGGVYGIGRLHA